MIESINIDGNNKFGEGIQFDMESYLKRQHINFKISIERDIVLYRICCPWGHGPVAFTWMKMGIGEPNYGCLHNDCSDKTWQDFYRSVSGEVSSEVPDQLFESKSSKPLEPPKVIEEDLRTQIINERTSILAQTLCELIPDLDSGRLAIGVILEKYNQLCRPTMKLASAKAMGSLIRAHGLTILGKRNSNKRKGVYCLIWDEQTERLLELTSPPSL